MSMVDLSVCVAILIKPQNFINSLRKLNLLIGVVLNAFVCVFLWYAYMQYLCIRN